MPAEQFSAPVRGAAGTPLQTTEQGSMQTDNYDHGGAFEFDGTAYPYTVDPVDRLIQEVMLTDAGDIDMTVETIHGDTFTVRLADTVGRWQIWEIESLTFEDPRGTAAPLYGAWGGE